MPQSAQRKAEYQRKRRQAKAPETAQANDSSEGTDLGGEHYWGAVSKAPEGKRICTAFEFRPGQWIGGCGQIVDWTSAIPTNLNGEPDLAVAIIDSPYYKEIQGEMPVTKAREQR